MTTGRCRREHSSPRERKQANEVTSNYFLTVIKKQLILEAIPEQCSTKGILHLTEDRTDTKISYGKLNTSTMNVSFSQTTPKVTQQGDFGQGLSNEHLCFLLQ